MTANTLQAWQATQDGMPEIGDRARAWAAADPLFAQLWHRDTAALTKVLPGPGEGGVDWERAEAALSLKTAIFRLCDLDSEMRTLLNQSDAEAAA